MKSLNITQKESLQGLWTANTGGEKIKYYEAMTERDEAEYVVRNNETP